MTQPPQNTPDLSDETIGGMPTDQPLTAGGDGGADGGAGDGGADGGAGDGGADGGAGDGGADGSA